MWGICQEEGIKKRAKEKKKKGEDSNNLHDFGDLCNLALKKEEEY